MCVSPLRRLHMYALVRALGYISVFVSIQQFHEFVYLALQFVALVSIAHTHAVGAQLYYLVGGHDVSTIDNSIFGGSKRLVLNQFKPSAVEYKGVTGNACGIVIRLGKSTINYHQTTIGSYGTFATTGSNGHMPIDDMAVFALHLELIENFVAYVDTVTQGIVIALGLGMCGFVFDEVTFESRHLGLVKER